MLTIEGARKIIGKEAVNFTDEEITRDIEAAELLKNIFFSHHIYASKNQSKFTGMKSLNMP